MLSFRRSILLPLLLGGLATLPASAGLPSLDQIHAMVKSFSPSRALKMTLMDNGTSEPATITIIDRFAPVGHALVVDADNGNLIQDLTSSGDSFTLPAMSKVGFYFIPTAKAIGLTFRIQIGQDEANVMEFNLKKQFAVPLFADAKWDLKKETARVAFTKDNFENPDKGACWTCLDKK